jgi:glycosyltransferase involved in cell wall biosynthesis
MNILYDYQIFSLQQYGGISRYFYEIANRLAALPGNEVEIFAPLYVNEYFHNNDGVRPWGIKTKPFLGFGIINAANRSLSRLLMKSRRDVDIFHETYYSMSDYCPVSTKRVITVYDMIHEKLTEYFPAAAEYRKTKAHSVQRADHVICISENTKRDLIEFLKVPEENVSVVYLGCSLKSVAEKKTNNPTADQKPYILFVGVRHGYKNFERLLRVYASSSLLRRESTIVCFGWRGFLPDEWELMRSLDIPTDSVKHVSGSDDVLAGLYASAAAFVYPSLYEGFGIPLLEAMSLGCPVVCSNTSSFPEVAGDAAELFDPYDEAAMRAAIERVISTPKYAAALVEKGRRRAGLFSWEKCARDTFGVYHNVLEG